MIVLRRLELKDIPYMLEWMHDTETKLIFQNDFLAVDEVKAVNFILNSFNDDNKHFAIVDNSNDEYLGTISLKNIDNKNRNAEYAISTRRIARGKGINMLASNLIINYGFNELNLNKIYLNVLSKNERAIKFYKKIGFKHEGTFKQHLYMYSEYYDLEWYAIIRGDRT